MNKPRRRWPLIAGAGTAATVLALALSPAGAATDPTATPAPTVTAPDGSRWEVTTDNTGKLGTKQLSGPTATPTTTSPTTTPTTTPTGTPGTVTGITYTSQWQSGTNGDRYTVVNGATATVTFTGTSITLRGITDAHHVNARVTIDGQDAGTTTSRSTTRSNGPVTIYTRTGLTSGSHTLVLTAAGTVSFSAATATGSTTSPTGTATTGTPTASPTSTTPTSSPTSTTQPPASGTAVALKRVGNQLQYVTGGEAWLVGYNSFTMGGGCGSAAELSAASQANSKAFIDTMRHDGHGVLRLFYWSGYSSQVKANLQELVNYAASKNVYVVLTLSDGQKGCGNAGPTTLDANSYAHVKEAATRFKGNPGVAFFEAANEPTSSDWSAGFLNRVRGTYDTIKSIDSTRLVGSGTQASYFLGGTDRQAEVNKIVDVTSMHDYEGGCDASRTKQELSLSQGKPMVMGEFGTLDSGSFNSRSGIFACKLATWKNYDGFAGAFGWSWQPGNGGSASEYGNLDADTKTQQVLRAASLG